MELSDTIKLMLSDDFRDRFIAEYYQLCIRIEKLQKMLDKHDAGEIQLENADSIALLRCQLNVMHEYECVLRGRAKIENINL